MASTTMSSPYAIPTTISDSVLTTTLSDYSKKLVDNVYNDVVMFKLASEAGTKELLNGGASITKHLIKEKQDDGGFYLGADILNNVQGHDTTLLEYKWQNAYEPIVITRDEERSNSGDAHKLIDLAGMKTQLSQRAITDRLDQALSTNVAESNNLIDIDEIVGTGTLGSVAGGTYTFWQATRTTSGAFATQGLTDMATATYAVSSSAVVENPTMYLTTKTIFQKFEQTRLPLERISNGNLSANSGFTNLTFKGKPVIYGNYIGSGLLYGLNMNYIYLVVDSETDLITTPFITPTNQTVKVAYILWRGNMLTDNRRRHFRLSSIT